MIIFYTLNGNVKNKEKLNFENLEHSNGMKTRCYLKDGTVHIGFASLYDNLALNPIETKGYYLWTFENLDEAKHVLLGESSVKYKQSFEKINISDIVKVESILYSNPRWGGILTNLFQFSE